MWTIETLRDEVAHLVETKGLRTFSRASGVPVSTIRHFIREDRKSFPTWDTVEKFAASLNVEVLAGRRRQPYRDFSAEYLVIAKTLVRSRVKGWYGTEEDGALPLPFGADDVDAYYLRATDVSMAPDGVMPGDYCLVVPGAPVVAGHRVCLTDERGLQSLRRLVHLDGDWMELRGWLEPERGVQRPLDERLRVGTVDVSPVVAVYDGKPNVDTPPLFKQDEVRRAIGLEGLDFGEVPLLGYVGADAAAVFNADPLVDEMVSGPPTQAAEGLVALETRGTSMDPAIRDRDLIYFRQTAPDPDAIVGRIVVAVDVEGSAFVKVLRRGDDLGTWNLESINRSSPTLLNVRLDRVSPVEWVQCRGRPLN